MDERARAIRILRQTRDTLAARLTERILEAEEEILAEAEGHAFFSEIETLYDQFGLRLAHVNQMLAHLPAAPASEEPASEERLSEKPVSKEKEAGPSSRSPLARRDNSDAPHGPHANFGGARAEAASGSISSFLALPAPSESRGGSGTLASTTLLMFAVHARRGDLESAALSLEALFGLTRERSLACARVFHGHCARDAAYAENAARLHNYLQADALSRAFGLLCESFGLAGGEALSALMWWRARTTP